MVCVTVLPDDVDTTEYPDDFEEADEEELAEVVNYARIAIQSLSDDESSELQDSGGLSVTMKTLRDKCIGQYAVIFSEDCSVFV